jgi:hypothetical protein
MNYENVKSKLESLTADSGSRIALLSELSLIVNKSDPEWEGRDLVIRALDKLALFDEVEQSLLFSLVRAVGLFPYMSKYIDEISYSDRLAVEMHRVEGVEKGLVFHRLQAHVFSLLTQGRNVVLSASTSVGKSLVIDAVLAQKNFRKVVVIVPTIALIDETRRRLTRRFRSHYNVITHQSQEAVPDVTNVYLLTQERVLQRDDLEDVDFVVVDEFYKLDLASDGDENGRAIDLSLAFHKLAKQRAQFYLLGPHIQNIQGLDAYEYNFIPSTFATVAVDVHYFNLPFNGNAQKDKLLELCAQITSPTLIYCQSPASANRVAQLLIDEGKFALVEATAPIAQWISEHYHPQWNVAKAISLGIGIHHGGVPRALQQYFVKLFNEGVIRHIICTSTMIEGVNTSAESVIIYDRRVSNTPFDHFTFKNISGRAGRMNQYFIGKVYMLESPPVETDQTVEYPVGLQDENSPMGMLLKLEKEYLTDLSLQRVGGHSAPGLSQTTLVENRYIPIERQIEVAERILREHPRSLELLNWNGIPEPHQQEYLCQLVYDHLPHKLADYNIHSGSQLHWHINALRIGQKDFPQYLQQAINEDHQGRTPSEAIGQRLKLIRNIMCYKLPRDFMAISRIQEDIFGMAGLDHGDFALFAEQLENLFHEPLLTALDEYGIPIQISSKLKWAILPSESLNEMLGKVRMLAPRIASFGLEQFEQDITRWAIEDM